MKNNFKYFKQKIIFKSCEKIKKNILLFVNYIKFDSQFFLLLYIFYFEFFFQFCLLEFDFIPTLILILFIVICFFLIIFLIEFFIYQI